MEYKERKSLERRLKELEKEKKEITRKLEIAYKEANKTHLAEVKMVTFTVGIRNFKTFPLSPYSLQGKVINGTVELIGQMKREVTSEEILNFLKKKNINLGKNEPMLLAAILGQEVNKKNSKLIRVARGLYNLKVIEEPKEIYKN